MHDISMLVICFTIIRLLQIVHTSPTVQINNSQIIGQRISFSGHEVNQYLGIPYAQPPVGPLRFKKPLPFQNYTEKLQANTNPPACSQYSIPPTFPWYAESPEKSEDCLYLNIWTPAEASPSNKKAVLYWIFGGGFRYGSMRTKPYSGIPLSTLGDIIVVTVNYRVGPFGFLTSGTEDAPPNVGLWDMLEGLKWVNRNIESFGGDLQRITIAGESVGAISVGFLTISPLAQGLYTRLIMESGAPIGTGYNNPGHISLSQKLAKKVGCANESYPIAIHPKEVVQCMRDVDADTLSRAEYELDPNAVLLFLPQWGDDLLPVDPRIAIKEGNFGCKDLLIGNNKDDGSFFITTADPKLYGFLGKKNPSINITLGRDASQKCVGSQSIVKYYLPDNITEHSHNRIRHQAYKSCGDFINVCPDVYYAEKCAEQNRNVYFYYFTHRPSVTPWAEWMGVAHFAEVQFVFGQPILSPEKYQPYEVSLSHLMVNIWSSFVKQGTPNMSWPLYSRENHAFIYLGPKNVTGKSGVGPHLKNCNFLRPFLIE